MAISGADFGMGVSLTLVDDFSANAGKIGNSFDGLQGKVTGGGVAIADSMNQVRSSMMGVLNAVAIIAPWGVAINEAMNFEAVISDVGAKSRASAGDIELLRKEALRLGEATQFSAKQAAEGQAFLAQAGFNTQQIIQALPATLDLASAGNLNLARSADIASNIMAGFQLKASDMARVSDVLALAANSSNTNIEQLSDGMKYLAPTAAALGVSIEEATAAVSLLANAGLQGSLGTRALGTSLASRLTKPTKDAAKVMQNLGFNVFDVQGNFVGMADMVERLDSSLAGLSQQQRLAAISTIFGGEAIQEVLVLLGQEVEVMKDGRKEILRGADALRHFTNANEKAAGTAERIAKQKLDNLKGDVILFQSAFETAMIQLGAAITLILRPVVQFFTELTQKVSAFIATPLGKSIAMVSAGLSGMLASLIAIGAALPLIKTGFAAARAGVLLFSGAMLPITIAVGAVVGGIMLAISSVKEFDKVMNGAAAESGFVGFLQKTGGLIRGVISLFSTWNGRTFTMSKQIKESLEKTGMLDFFLTLSTWIVRGIELFKGFGEGVSSVFSQVSPLYSSLADSFLNLINTIAGLFSGFDKAGGSALQFKSVGEAIAKFIGSVFVPVFEKAVWIITKFLDMASEGIKMAQKIGGVITKLPNPFELSANLGKSLLDFGFFGDDQSKTTSTQAPVLASPTGSLQESNNITSNQRKLREVNLPMQRETIEVLKSLKVDVMIDGQKVAESVNQYNETDFARY